MGKYRGEIKSIICKHNAAPLGQKLHGTCKWNQLDNVAIEYHDTQEVIYVLYRELYAAKNLISDYLKCLKNPEFIGIHFDVPEYCVVQLMLGILSSEHSFVNVPLDVADFAKLKNHLGLNYLFCKELIVEGNVVCEFEIHNARIYFVKLHHVQQQQLPKGANDNCYAYAICTSGTTRTPKVVKVLHSCIVPNILDFGKILAINEHDKVSQFTSLTFDPSIVEIFLALSNAASLFIPSRSLRKNPIRLLETAHSSQITMLQTTPSVFMHSWTAKILRTTILSNRTSLRAILLGGESFPKLEFLIESKHPQNNTKFYNVYGITEVSCWGSINEVILTNGQYDRHHLGQVLSHTLFDVRNEREESITRGSGSLYIGSNNRICVIDNEDIAELELPLFRDTGDIVTIDEDGRIYYKGRRNSIIKRFGNKVDTSILEAFALQLDFVKSCYAVWDDISMQLNLCVVAKEDVTHNRSQTSTITKHLHKLQHLYRPDRIHFLEHVEFTSNGKVSLEFLRRRKPIRTIIGNNLSDVESIFKSTWEDNLKRGDGGFVKLGGTSIAALQISNAISIATGMEFPELIGMLLMDSTINECLSYIKNVTSSVAENDTSNRSGSEFDESKRTPLINTLIIEPEASEEHAEVKKKDHNSTILADEIYTCDGYKCRGQKFTNVRGTKEESRIRYNAISRVKVLQKYDLKKCIDASPTVFHCSDRKTYATVGSHSGFIITFELGQKNCDSAFKIKLPDRIEASVLTLDNFKGIVGCYDGSIYCLHLKTGKIIWKYQTEDVVKCTAILCKEKKVIFVGSYDCHVYCLSATDGSLLWKTKCSNGSISATGCLHSSSNTVLFGTLDGSCLALKQSSGSIFWKRKLPNPIFVAPVSLSNGIVLFCTVTGSLCCFDIEVNIKLWAYEIHGNVFSYLVQQCDGSGICESIIVASQNKNLYCLEFEDGNLTRKPTLKYTLSFDSPIFATPWCEENFIFIACTDGTLNIYDSHENRLVKIDKLPGEVYSSLVVENDIAIVGCRDNNLYALQLVTDVPGE